MSLLLLVLLGYVVAPIIGGFLIRWLMERMRVSHPKFHSQLWTAMFLISGSGVAVALVMAFFSGLGLAGGLGGGGGGGPSASIWFPSGSDFLQGWALVGSLIVFFYLIGKGRPS
ncbi:MAG: hypothetical protein FD161_3612 [Limisphaerales bacterium]|nr:MAG: hypothetical protein FD161_3612 [Limisphaerales bacterium]KAG0507548.1 MAG: hypothetical protein E1N63_3278 [Limisphaerales bacterium]TXT48010.1 MAG: hypothetical protein FD140_3845 [Limisphaerales bacterium]